ncbi:hypothetical protein KM043_008738 [Ampulex compressa]|nr:hypothetical protein KM043_008738 [Ampulex compressa]
MVRRLEGRDANSRYYAKKTRDCAYARTPGIVRPLFEPEIPSSADAHLRRPFCPPSSVTRALALGVALLISQRHAGRVLLNGPAVKRHRERGKVRQSRRERVEDASPISGQKGAARHRSGRWMTASSHPTGPLASTSESEP